MICCEYSKDMPCLGFRTLHQALMNIHLVPSWILEWFERYLTKSELHRSQWTFKKTIRINLIPHIFCNCRSRCLHHKNSLKRVPCLLIALFKQLKHNRALSKYLSHCSKYLQPNRELGVRFWPENSKPNGGQIDCKALAKQVPDGSNALSDEEEKNVSHGVIHNAFRVGGYGM